MKAILFSFVLFGCVVYGLSVPCTKADAQKCIQSLQTAKDNHNITSVCSSLSKGESCLTALSSKGCSKLGDFTKFLDKVDVGIDDTELAKGCDGNCGKPYGECLGPVAQIISGSGTYDENVCSKITKAMTCVENIKATQCPTKLRKYLDAFAMKEKKDFFSDVCDNSGNPTPCLKNMNDCYKQFIKPVKVHANRQLLCKDAQGYIDCQNKQPCGSLSTVGKFNEQMVGKLETQETKLHCPIIGTCDDRLNLCSTNLTKTIEELLKVHSKDTGKFCSDVHNAHACLDFVRKDKWCSRGVQAIIDFETKLGILETKLNCSSTCLDRLNDCANELTATVNYLMDEKSKNRTAYCSNIKDAHTCLDGVRKDTMCAKGTQNITSFEADLTRLETNIKCHASSLVFSTILMVLGVVIGMSKNI